MSQTGKVGKILVTASLWTWGKWLPFSGSSLVTLKILRKPVWTALQLREHRLLAPNPIHTGGWRDGSVVKHTGCSSRGPQFSELHGSSQISVTVSGDPGLIPSNLMTVRNHL